MAYQSPKITVDGVLFHEYKILLIKRKYQPFKGAWALPGGFVEYGETTENAVIREMKEETGLNTKISSLIGVYSDPQRDPRGHTISVVYLLQKINGDANAGDDAADLAFFDVDKLPTLSFDHHKIIEDAIRRKKDVLSKM